MMRLRSDLVELCMASLEQRLDQVTAEWDSRAALGVVLAAGGYPAQYQKGDIINGLNEAAQLDGKVFHAGTAEQDGNIITAGGRVLCACALGETVAEAQTNAYAIAEQINWDGVYCRTDIGYRALARL